MAPVLRFSLNKRSEKFTQLMLLVTSNLNANSIGEPDTSSSGPKQNKSLKCLGLYSMGQKKYNNSIGMQIFPRFNKNKYFVTYLSPPIN